MLDNASSQNFSRFPSFRHISCSIRKKFKSCISSSQLPSEPLLRFRLVIRTKSSLHLYTFWEEKFNSWMEPKDNKTIYFIYCSCKNSPLRRGNGLCNGVVKMSRSPAVNESDYWRSCSVVCRGGIRQRRRYTLVNSTHATANIFGVECLIRVKKTALVWLLSSSLHPPSRSNAH